MEDPADFKPPYKGKQAELLRVYYDPTPQGAGKLFDNKTTAFQVKGELLRRVDYRPILRWIMEASGSVTRLDLFKDDFRHRLKSSEIFSLCSIGNYAVSVQSPLVKSHLDIYPGENSTYIGSKTGGKQINIYNKGIECGEKFHHIRVELRLRKDNKFQTAIVRQLVEGADEEQLISSLLSKYLAFKMPGSGRIHDRKPYSWWTDFLDSTAPVRRCDFVPTEQPAGKTLSQLERREQRLREELARLKTRMETLRFDQAASTAVYGSFDLDF